MTHPMRAAILFTATALALWPGAGARSEPLPDPRGNWTEIEQRARGETVTLALPGAPEEALRFFGWAGEELQRLHGVTLALDTSEAAGGLAFSSQAGGTDAGGRASGGQDAGRQDAESQDGGGAPRTGGPDLVWIEGDGFGALKSADLLSVPFAGGLPNWRFVDLENHPEAIFDAGTATDFRAVPLGLQRLTFFADTSRAGPQDRLPRGAEALADWAGRHPGRLALPAPASLLGHRFLEQMLFETADDRSVLSRPVEDSDFETATARLWPLLERLGAGRAEGGDGASMPASEAEALAMLARGEADIVPALNPQAGARGIRGGTLPSTVRPVLFEGGMIGGAHMLAIPKAAAHPAGALVAANFLVSPQAQSRKGALDGWADPSVLALKALPEPLREAMRAQAADPALPTPRALALVIPEPHPGWGERLAAEWQRRLTR